MTNKFKIGDEVKFNTEDKNLFNVKFFSEPHKIPKSLIFHGDLIFKENKGTISSKYEEFYIVRYLDKNNHIVQLGFKEESLLPFNTEASKEIIGYKLVKTQYSKAACEIARVDDVTKMEKLILQFYPKSHTLELLEKAGVLDLWFEPIYKQKEIKIIDSRSREAIIMDDKLLVADGEISLEELEQIRDFSLLQVGTKLWSVKLTQATFKIGCWDNVSLEDINKAIETIKSNL